MKGILCIFGLLFLLGLLNCNAEKIVRLPGQPSVSFDQYSGYVTVNEKDGRALFYWLTEAPSKTASKLPLVLWLNGGPGCSSVAYGASEEVGPFRIRKDASGLYLNKHSWNKFANLLFLESPAGVGFSYTNTSTNLRDSGDKRTAEDALVFLLNWFEKFPQYKNRDFYICGESYAGHYIPQLARKVYQYNKANSKATINLKGVMIGNGVTNDYYDSIGTIQYWWSHTLISDETYRGILKNCNFSQKQNSKPCNDLINHAMNVEFGNIDPYSIYTPTCSSTSSKALPRFRNSLLRSIAGYDPCTENYAEVYYNRPDVQKAFNANTTHIPYNWTSCSNILFTSWKDSQFDVLPIYKELMAAGVRIWVYSGDTDSVVPVTATRFSLGHLRMPIKKAWYPWYMNKHTVGGWSEVYEKLTFASVRGAGHEVPLFQPKRALMLFKYFLHGQSLPTNNTFAS